MRIHPDFADAADDIRGFGALGGAGAEGHYTVKTNMNPDGSGMVFRLQCDNCGQPNEVLVDWGEFVFGMNGACPPNWRAHEMGGFHPNAGCRTCQYILLFLVTPDECARHIKSGIMAGRVSQQDVQQLSQQIAQQRAAHRR